jgi:hypothetical protein
MKDKDSGFLAMRYLFKVFRELKVFKVFKDSRVHKD